MQDFLNSSPQAKLGYALMAVGALKATEHLAGVARGAWKHLLRPRRWLKARYARQDVEPWVVISGKWDVLRTRPINKIGIFCQPTARHGQADELGKGRIWFLATKYILLCHLSRPCKVLPEYMVKLTATSIDCELIRVYRGRLKGGPVLLSNIRPTIVSISVHLKFIFCFRRSLWNRQVVRRRARQRGLQYFHYWQEREGHRHRHKGDREIRGEMLLSHLWFWEAGRPPRSWEPDVDIGLGAGGQGKDLSVQLNWYKIGFEPEFIKFDKLWINSNLNILKSWLQDVTILINNVAEFQHVEFAEASPETIFRYCVGRISKIEELGIDSLAIWIDSTLSSGRATSTATRRPSSATTSWGSWPKGRPGPLLSASGLTRPSHKIPGTNQK